MLKGHAVFIDCDSVNFENALGQEIALAVGRPYYGFGGENTGEIITRVEIISQVAARVETNKNGEAQEHFIPWPRITEWIRTIA